MMQPASYLLMNEATHCRHPVDKQVPWCILLGIGIGLDPQAIAH
jgi:hypothetical protein